MELDRREGLGTGEGAGTGAGAGKTGDGKTGESQVELATITVTAEEITEEEDDGSPWSARKNRRDAGPQSPDDLQNGTMAKGEGTETFANGSAESASKGVPLKTLTLGAMVAAGIQFGWALQLSLLTPYVQTLGIPHDFISFIWLCGPVTGLVVQPWIGIWSDQCKSKWGRRRPFILFGAFMVATSVTIIGFSADLGYLLGDSQDCRINDPKYIRVWGAAVFILGFWLLDVANNTIQGPARALLADLAGSGQCDAANAIFCLWMAVGNIMGFSAGASSIWSKWFPFLQSKACCEACANLKAAFLVAVIFLAFCTIITLVFAKETPLMSTEKKPDPSEQQMKRIEDSSPLLVKRDDGVEESVIMVPVESQQVIGTGMMNRVNKDHDRGPTENGYHAFQEEEEKEHLSMGPGAVMVNILTGVRKLPGPMKVVLTVMAFCWLSWFPFLLYDTDWMGREVFGGDPNLDRVTYEKGVHIGALGLLLNSVVLAISSFLIDPMCRRLGSKHVWALGNYVIFACMACTAVVTLLASDVRVDGNGKRTYVFGESVKVAAVILFTILGFPLAITYSVPYSLTAELIADSGGGQGLAMGILNLAVVVPQILIALGAGPFDSLFGGGNEPSFVLAAIFALTAGIIATKYLPRLSRQGYQRAIVHGFG